MSSKVDLLKKKIAELQAQLEVEMAKNLKVSDCTLPIPIGKKTTIVKRTAPKAIKKPDVIWNINEIKRPDIIGNVEEPKAYRVIKTPKTVKVDDKRKRYVNPITLNYVLRPTYLAVLCKIEKKDAELQRKFKDVSQNIEKKINNQKSWFPLKKALRNYTKSFGIKIINKNERVINKIKET